MRLLPELCALLCALPLAGPLRAADPTVVRTVYVLKDGTKIIIEETAGPPRAIPPAAGAECRKCEGACECAGGCRCEAPAPAKAQPRPSAQGPTRLDYLLGLPGRRSDGGPSVPLRDMVGQGGRLSVAFVRKHELTPTEVVAVNAMLARPMPARGVPAADPFPPTPITRVIGAGPVSTASSGSYRPGSTYTAAPAAVMRGGTSAG